MVNQRRLEPARQQLVILMTQKSREYKTGPQLSIRLISSTSRNDEYRFLQGKTSAYSAINQSDFH